jgi:acyl carrier protein
MNSISPLQASLETIESWLIATTAKHAGLDEDQITVDQPFASYGLDSLAATTISADLEDWIGMLWDYPTIRDLTLHLATLPRVTRLSSVTACPLDYLGEIAPGPV